VIPQTAAALLAFLFLVAPGIVFENLRERRRPTFDQTTFQEVSRLALASLCFSVLSLILLAGVRAVVPKILPDPGRWLLGGNGYVQAHYQVVASFFLAELAIAVALAIAWSSYLSKGRSFDIRRISGWHLAFRQLQPSNADTFVLVIILWPPERLGRAPAPGPERGRRPVTSM
jgi:Family of unknown function (DUF6338)